MIFIEFFLISNRKRNNSGSKIFYTGVPGTTTEACPGRPGTTTEADQGRPGTTTEACPGRPGTTTEADQGRPGTTLEADQGILGKMGTIEDRISNWTNLEIKNGFILSLILSTK